jgi:hypothetical protein
MPPVRLGKIPSGIGTADLFVTICDGELPLLRVDLYPDSSSESAVSQDAIVWHDHVFVGLGHTVYVIDPKARLGFALRLESYFSAFYLGEDYRGGPGAREWRSQKLTCGGWHDFRHTLTRMMRRAGVNAVVVSGTLGHKKVELAAEVYDRASSTDIGQALQVVGKQLLPTVLPNQSLN